MSSDKRDMDTHVDKITFRLFSPYTEKVALKAKAANITPNQFARIATMGAADSGLLDLKKRLDAIEEFLIRFRRDFNLALDGSEE